MKKYGLEFTRERLSDAFSGFGVMTVGCFIGIILASRYGLDMVLLGSVIILIICAATSLILGRGKGKITPKVDP